MSLNQMLGMEILQAMQQAKREAKQEAKQKEKQNIPLTSEPENTEKIKLSPDIQDLLLKIEYPKLRDLYKSLCRISLIEDPALGYIAAWSFLESLSAIMRAEEKKLPVTKDKKEKAKKKKRKSFNLYFEKKIEEWYKGKAEEKKDINNALEEISKRGNSGKHSARRRIIDAQQLHDDFERLEDFIILCLEEVIKKQPKT